MNEERRAWHYYVLVPLVGLVVVMSLAAFQTPVGNTLDDAGFTWGGAGGVIPNVTTFLSEDIALNGTTALMAITFGPAVVAAVFSIVRRRR